jgi:hypothetical protein
MPYYFVAKTPNGQFVGQFPLEEILVLVKRGEITPDDVVTESLGTYAELVRDGNASWITVAALLAHHPNLATDQTPSAPPLPPTHPNQSKAQRIAGIALGFMAGACFWAMPFLFRGYDGIPWLIFACFGLPVVSVILAIIRPTRRFGLGLLLACGLGWLILLAICGGAAALSR